MKYKAPTFLIPCLFLWLFDVATTLAGQSAGYWAGNFSGAKELNPLFFWFLSKGPDVFIVATVVYIFILVVILFLVPLRIAIMTAYIASIVHMVGVAGWMLQMKGRMVGIILTILLFISVKIVLDKEWQRFMKAYSYI
ncbi:MAG: hypothetical protein ACYSWZ_03185 [Planctomycetota bacterium]|jgi:hypothetical protein